MPMYHPPAHRTRLAGMMIMRNLARDQQAWPFVTISMLISQNSPRISKMSCLSGVKQMGKVKKRKVAKVAKEEASAPSQKHILELTSLSFSTVRIIVNNTTFISSQNQFTTVI
jgi:hypothetical protein